MAVNQELGLQDRGRVEREDLGCRGHGAGSGGGEQETFNGVVKGTLHRHILAGAVILAEQGRPFNSFPQLWREIAVRKLNTKQFGCGFRRRCWFWGGGQGKVDAVLTHFLLSDDMM